MANCSEICGSSSYVWDEMSAIVSMINASYSSKNSSIENEQFSSSISQGDSLFYMKKPICIYLDCAKVQSDAQW